MNAKYLFLFLLVLFLSETISAQKWQEIRTVKDICNVYPDKVKTMFSEYNLDYPGLEKVKKAYQNGDVKEACTHLLEYYRNSSNAMYLRVNQPAETTKTVALSDTILNDVFVIQNVRGQVRYGEDGHRDWYYKGPNNDEEWAWLSNRHSQLSTVLSTYFETGNPKYAEYIDLFLRDFIIKSMPYPAVKSNTSVWRGLEVAARTKVWSRIFYGLLNSEHLSPATQLLMLCSLPDHAHYNRNFHGGNNWLTMEISALATVATNFPEYKDSEEWLNYSMGTMIESMKDQVYPDGVQTELTSHYHNVSLANFELFKNICDKANKKLPDFFNQTIEDMYAYLAHAMRPDGNRVLNNDGDRGNDRNLILKGAKRFNNSEWEYIATNRESGTKPVNGPSWVHPWAGHLISRSGYDVDAHWSFFDIGPWGSGHQHSDKLHLSISAYGKDLLVDAGRFAYKGEVARKFRQYAKSSRSHNLVLLDGKVQNPGPKLAEKPLLPEQYKITNTFDYASGTFNNFSDIEGVGEHLRTLFYVRGEFWIVVDKIKTDRERTVETLWHWHPDCTVLQENGIVKTNNRRGNLAVIPVSKQKFDIKFIEGQEEPVPQGWYSPEYNKYESNVASIYSTNIESEETLVWLLVPSENEVPEIYAKIISENETEIKLEVITEERGSWKLTIPYQDSKKAKLEFN